MYQEAAGQQVMGSMYEADMREENPVVHVPSGGWVCSSCGWYNGRLYERCCNTDCWSDRFAKLYEQLDYDPMNPVMKPLDRNMNVMFLKAPEKVTTGEDIHTSNLPLMSWFVPQSTSAAARVTVPALQSPATDLPAPE